MPRTDVSAWRPFLDSEYAQKRRDFLRKIRKFFDDRDYLEVETPLLGEGVPTDPNIEPFAVECGGKDCPRWLASSPEFHMKRLLAAGYPAIYQICKAFRKNESGERHRPEFSMLEWYRPGWRPEEFMGELSDLLEELGAPEPAENLTYREVFRQYAGFDPAWATEDDFCKCCSMAGVPELEKGSREEWLQYLMSSVVEAKLGSGSPCFVKEWPEWEKALARTGADADGWPIAFRFELYWKGLELANGYWELCDAGEQAARFEEDHRIRRQKKQVDLPGDSRFLSAMESGMPECTGCAIGLERLMMATWGEQNISATMLFPEG